MQSWKWYPVSTNIHSVQEGSSETEQQEGKIEKEVLRKLLSSFINQNIPIYFGENGDCCITQRKLLSSFLHYRISIFQVAYRRKKQIVQVLKSGTQR